MNKKLAYIDAKILLTDKKLYVQVRGLRPGRRVSTAF